MVSGASRIELRAAVGANVATVQIRLDGERLAACSTQHGVFAEALLRPLLGRVIGKRFVTRVARIVDTAAPKPYRDDVTLAIVMRAPRIGIRVDSADAQLV